MKIMFNSCKKNHIKKKFQKPNILRKNAWLTSSRSKASEENESHDKNLAFTHTANIPQDLKKENITPQKLKAFYSVKKLPEILKMSDSEDHNVEVKDSRGCTSTKQNTKLENKEDALYFQYFDKFFSNCGNSQSDNLFDDLLVTSAHQRQEITPKDELSNQIVSDGDIKHDDKFHNPIVKYQCTEPDCKKEFKSESNLSKHMSVHSVASSNKGNRIIKTTRIECPAKKMENETGEMKPCGEIYWTREEIWKHLNQEHTLEDASHKCPVCGRRFFWASGLRVHGRRQCGRDATIPCEWPGCTRVFRQPCRLREHQRAHNGDKPYHCQHPSCGWSFRSASKLVRHARRHTDERPHACDKCGRAFLRREHMREHAARCHHRRDKDYHLLDTPHRCTHAGCSQSFTNSSSLQQHIKRIHRNNDDTNIVTITVVPSAKSTVHHDMFTVTLDQTASFDMEESTISNVEEDAEVMMETETKVDAETETEWHSARTHCTWPLPSRGVADYVDTYVLEEDVQVDQSESSESNVYTIRSDLFLHSNIPYNEDSQSMVAVAEADCVAEAEIEAERVADAESGGGLVLLPHAPLDHDLGLDTHSTIDLMQEQLMYTEEAVDESSFRVFLLNDDELA